MKTWLLMCLLLLTTLAAPARKKDWSLEKLMGTCLMPEATLVKALTGQGFLPAGGDTVLFFEKKTKKSPSNKTILLQHLPDRTLLHFGTVHASEFFKIAQELKRSGFFFAPEKTMAPGVHQRYQRGAWCVSPAIVQQNGTTWYQLVLENKKLPPPQAIRYFEDLLQLPTHEYLAATFGAAQVRRDVFYFSEKEMSKCSVLFPNTTRQVIVVWKDDVNNQGIDLLVLGGQTQGANTAAFRQAGSAAQWQTKQGLFVGMTLRQLQEANGAPLELWGWETEEPGVVWRNNTGLLDFKNVGVQLQCLDCNEDRFYGRGPLLSSAVLLQQGRRVFVNTLVLKPE